MSPSTFAPITRLPLQMHDCSDENVFAFHRVDNAVRKSSHQTSPESTANLTPPQRSPTQAIDGTFNCGEECLPKTCFACLVIRRCLDQFSPRFRIINQRHPNSLLISGKNRRHVIPSATPPRP